MTFVGVVPASMPFEVHTSVPRSGRAQTTVVLRGDHDLATVGTVAETLERAASQGGDVIVDLGAVTFIDGATLGALVRASNAVRVRGGSLTLRSPSPCARGLVELCGLGELLETVPPTATVQPALTSWVEVPASPAARPETRESTGRPEPQLRYGP